MKNLLTLQHFVKHLETATRKAGFIVADREGPILTIMLHGQPVRCNMQQIYQAYQGAPDRLDDIVDVHLRSLNRVPPPPPPPTEKEAEQSLLPMLQPKKWIDETKKTNTPQLVYQPFVAGIVITYVLDMPQFRAYLNKNMLSQIMDQFEPALDTVHAMALENLRQRTTNRHYQTHGLGAETLIVCETDDGFGAARILLPELMNKWAGRIPGRMLLGIPNRDFLIAFSDRDPTHVRAITRQVRHDARHKDHPLCANLLVWENGKVKEYRPKH